MVTLVNNGAHHEIESARRDISFQMIVCCVVVGDVPPVHLIFVGIDIMMNIVVVMTFRVFESRLPHWIPHLCV